MVSIILKYSIRVFLAMRLLFCCEVSNKINFYIWTLMTQIILIYTDKIFHVRHSVFAMS